MWALLRMSCWDPEAVTLLLGSDPHPSHLKNEAIALYYSDKGDAPGRGKSRCKGLEVSVFDHSGGLRQCPPVRHTSLCPCSLPWDFAGLSLLQVEGTSFLFTLSSPLCFGQGDDSGYGSS